ncbi:MAG: hypothetical protein Q9167_002956 [Letrouitia subvulpina]
MADLSADQFVGFDYDPQDVQYSYPSRVSWPIPIDPNASRSALQQPANLKRSTSPLEGISTPYHQPLERQPPPLIPQWPIPPASNPQLGYSLDGAYPQQFAGDYPIPYQSSPTEIVPTQSQIDPAMQMNGSYLPLGSMSLSWQTTPYNDLVDDYSHANGLPNVDLSQQSLAEQSPTETYLEVRSLTDTSSEGWVGVDYNSYQPMEHLPDMQLEAISNPEQTLHPRTFSDSSYSDVEQGSQRSFSSYDIVPNALSSPGSDSYCDIDLYNAQYEFEDSMKRNDSPILISDVGKPTGIKKSTSPQNSPVSIDRSVSSYRRPQRRTNPKSSKTMNRRSPQQPKITSEAPGRRVGGRRGPLRPEQRKQACEIRKLGACLRCKFLKKTVPCTRIDIKDIAYFMKDWKVDYERHVTLSISIGNIKGIGDTERTLYITHGYGHYLPIKAREVFVRDEKGFGLDWVEKIKTPEDHEVNTAKMSAGSEGVTQKMISEYLDLHIDHGFEEFVDNYFEGTPFLTQMIKTAFRFWSREKTPVIRQALKLLVAYNLTQHVTMVEGIPDEEGFLGRIHDVNSRYRGKIMAPVMINFEVKVEMAKMWRGLQKDVLEELSHLYSSIYTKEKLKHWPTIFMVASILLSVWEEMQFDCHYRIPVRAASGELHESQLRSEQDYGVVNKFCSDMESTPVGVIVGLFSAISQKLPALIEWDSRKHHQLLGSNPAVCDALTEVRETVVRHGKWRPSLVSIMVLTQAIEPYLRTRAKATFDREDFDSLSNKFTSRLVIRAN